MSGIINLEKVDGVTLKTVKSDIETRLDAIICYFSDNKSLEFKLKVWENNDKTRIYTEIYTKGVTRTVLNHILEKFPEIYYLKTYRGKLMFEIVTDVESVQ